MSTDEKVAVDLRHDGQVLHLTLNAPKGNILDGQMMGGITAALEQHGEAPGLKAIVFEGAGKHFCFGASVEEHTQERAPEMLRQFHGLFRLLGRLGVPTCAVVRGQCLGGGMELATYCTWVFASSEAKLGQPEIQLAVLPPVASVLLPWRIGGSAAMDLCLRGHSISADEAHRLGLVHQIADDPAAACEAFIEKELLPKSGTSLRFAERAVRAELHQHLGPLLESVEKMYVDELMQSHDANEGIGAFLERRKPRFGAGKGK